MKYLCDDRRIGGDCTVAVVLVMLVRIGIFCNWLCGAMTEGLEVIVLWFWCWWKLWCAS